MRRIALTGAGGRVGHFVANRLRRPGVELTALGRRPVHGLRHLPYDLDGPVPDLSGHDALIHMGLAHLPGRYRGGEGDDPAGFRQRNLDGTRRLFDAAARQGIGRIVFLSSRAVYGDQPPGTLLDETTPCRPDTEYGRVKLAGEEALADCGVPGTSLRATGVYGPAPAGVTHKWAELFDDFRAGRPIVPRVATEVHGADLAAAVALALDDERAPPVLNVSDIVLDRRDLLAMVAEIAGLDRALPDRADPSRLNAMTAARLDALGWNPGGRPALRRTVEALLAD